MSNVDRESIFEQLKIDEGVEYHIYLDHLGYPTFGVGHLVLESDAEYGQPVGTPVSEERVQECFEKDLDTAISECEVMFGQETWCGFPSEVQEICVNMMFNLGRPRFSKFKNTIKYFKINKWSKAATEARDSRWYNQVGNRAERLCKRLESV